MIRASSRSLSILAFGLVSVVLVAGCVQTHTSSHPGSAPSFGEAPRDRITASDETNVHRRARVRLELATAYYARGQMTTALDEVKLALNADPQSGDAYNLRGLIYSALGDDELAEDSFRRASSINPRDGDVMHNHGWFLCQRQRYAEASEMFSKAMVQPQYSAVARTLLASGMCEARAGRLIQAEASLKRAFEVDSGNPVIAVNLAEVLLRMGELERARFYARRVNRSDADTNAQTLWLAARIEHRLGNVQAANEFGSRLRDRFPQSRESQAFDRGDFQ